MPHSSSSVTDFYSKLNPPSNSPKFAQISADFPRSIATKNLATRSLANGNLATWNLARLSPPHQVLPLSLLLPPLGSPVLEPHLHIEYKANLYTPYISNNMYLFIYLYTFLYYYVILLYYHTTIMLITTLYVEIQHHQIVILCSVLYNVHVQHELF